MLRSVPQLVDKLARVAASWCGESTLKRSRSELTGACPLLGSTQGDAHRAMEAFVPIMSSFAHGCMSLAFDEGVDDCALLPSGISTTSQLLENMDEFMGKEALAAARSMLPGMNSSLTHLLLHTEALGVSNTFAVNIIWSVVSCVAESVPGADGQGQFGASLVSTDGGSQNPASELKQFVSGNVYVSNVTCIISRAVCCTISSTGDHILRAE